MPEAFTQATRDPYMKSSPPEKELRPLSKWKNSICQTLTEPLVVPRFQPPGQLISLDYSYDYESDTSPRLLSFRSREEIFQDKDIIISSRTILGQSRKRKRKCPLARTNCMSKSRSRSPKVKLVSSGKIAHSILSYKQSSCHHLKLTPSKLA